MSKSYLFGDKPKEDFLEDYKPHLTIEDMEVMAFSKQYQAELSNKADVLSSLGSLFMSMLLETRRTKKPIRLTEVDCEALLEIYLLNKQIKR